MSINFTKYMKGMKKITEDYNAFLPYCVEKAVLDISQWYIIYHHATRVIG